MPPPRLNVRFEMDGFRCDLPGLKRGSNSGWILPFVAVWWLASGVALFVIAGVDPHFLDQDVSIFSVVAGGIGLMGWAPGWFVADAWYAHRNPRPIEVDAVGLTFDGRRWMFSELDRLAVEWGHLSFGKGRDWQRIRLGLNPGEEQWLKERIEEMYGAVHERGGAVPDALEDLVEDAER